jgi:hypothetical protein
VQLISAARLPGGGICEIAVNAALMVGQMQQTVITRMLAAWAAILAVPTAVAGIYGMNFKYMPELEWEHGISSSSGSSGSHASRCSCGSAA